MMQKDAVGSRAKHDRCVEHGAVVIRGVVLWDGNKGGCLVGWCRRMLWEGVLIMNYGWSKERW